MRSRSSPTFELFAFIFTLGWEGPLGIWIGIRDGSIEFVLVGLLITLFLWGLFGIPIIKSFLGQWDKS
ncbi:MAG: hypothetical protein HQ536_01250 [Parcubacteria group bacterium]|nr:hypothetical protein [Parcubacteria group bacterium]